MVGFLFLLMLILAIVMGSQIGTLKARFMRLEPHLEAMLRRITELERALEKAKAESTPPPEPETDTAYHDRWRAAAAAASQGPQIVSEPVDPPVPEQEAPIEPEPAVQEMLPATPEPVAAEDEEPVLAHVEEEPIVVEPEPAPEHNEPEDAQPEPELTPEPEPAMARERPSFSHPTRPKPSLPKISLSFEELIGGKLPIWVGGIALVVASFFLVGYAIDNGMLNHRVQVILAAIFGIGLLAGSEAARRIPKVADDPRVAQSLAGAGIASLYGTLYVASEAYHLIAPTTAFLLMAGVTAIALILSLRNGPPTAIMGLIGGFVAPFSATPTGNLVPLLVYLGLLVAGLFAVSLHRGWRWLAIAATGGGMTWSLGLMLTNQVGINASLGMFIVMLTIGATMIMPRFGLPNLRTRMIPMLAGFAQLAIFAHHIHFDLSGWMLYGFLSSAALYLGWRDARLMPASLAALGLVLILLIGGFQQGNVIVPWAAIGATLLFAVPGHALARRPHTDWYWTMLATVGGTAPALIAHYWGPSDLMTASQWGWLFAAAALPQAWLSWRARSEGRKTGRPDWALLGGGLAAGIMALYAAINWLSGEWQGAGILMIALGLSAWARRTADRALSLASVVFWAIGMMFWLFAFVADDQVPAAIFAAGGVPTGPALLALLVAPSALVLGIAWLHRGERITEPLCWVSLAIALGLPLALVPQLWHPVACFATALALGLALQRFASPFFIRSSLAVLSAGALYWLVQVDQAPDLISAVVSTGGVPPASQLLALLVIPAALIAGLAWCHRGRTTADLLRWLALPLALGLPLALVPALWHPVVCFAAALALGLWLKRTDQAFPNRASLAVLAIGLVYWFGQIALSADLFDAVFANGTVPATDRLAALLALPAVLIAGLGWCHKGKSAAGGLRWLALPMALAVPLAVVPALWHAAVCLGFAVALGLWLRRSQDEFFHQAGLFSCQLATLYWVWQVATNHDLLYAVFGAGGIPSADRLMALLVVPGLLLGLLAWTHAGRKSDNPLRTLSFAMTIALALALVPFVWQPAVLALITAMVLATENRLPLPRFAMAGMAVVTGLYMVWPMLPFALIIVRSFAGETAHYGLLDPMLTIAQMLAVPAAIFALCLWRFRERLGSKGGLAIKAGVALASMATLYALAKQPLAIATQAAFEWHGFVERAALTQALFVAALAGLWLGKATMRKIAWTLLSLALLRFAWFDLAMLNPVLVKQNVGTMPLLNAAALHYGLAALWLWLVAGLTTRTRIAWPFRYAALAVTLVAVGMAVRQFIQGPFLNAHAILEAEQYGYSAAYLGLAIVWLWRGIVAQARWQRVTALLLLTLVTLKVFVYDASRLEGLLRIFSFMGLGVALIAIGWAYNRFVSNKAAPVTAPLEQ